MIKQSRRGQLYLTEYSNNNENHVAYILLHGVLFQGDFYRVPYTEPASSGCGRSKKDHTALENGDTFGLHLDYGRTRTWNHTASMARYPYF